MFQHTLPFGVWARTLRGQIGGCTLTGVGMQHGVLHPRALRGVKSILATARDALLLARDFSASRRVIQIFTWPLVNISEARLALDAKVPFAITVNRAFGGQRDQGLFCLLTGSAPRLGLLRSLGTGGIGLRLALMSFLSKAGGRLFQALGRVACGGGIGWRKGLHIDADRRYAGWWRIAERGIALGILPAPGFSANRRRERQGQRKRHSQRPETRMQAVIRGRAVTHGAF